MAKEKIQSVSLNDFKLIIYAPQHNAISAGAAMKAVSYPIGILVTESKMAGINHGDGVVSKINMSFDGENSSCEAYVPAYDEIGALWGLRVSGKALQKVFDAAISECVLGLVGKFNFNHM